MFHQFQESKKLCINGVCLEFLSKFLSHNSKKLGRGTLLSFRKFPVSKKIMDKKGGVGGVSRITVRIVLSHSAVKNCRGIP